MFLEALPSLPNYTGRQVQPTRCAVQPQKERRNLTDEKVGAVAWEHNSIRMNSHRRVNRIKVINNCSIVRSRSKFARPDTGDKLEWIRFKSAISRLFL